MKIRALESLFNLLVCVWIDWQSYMVKIMNIIKSYRMTNPIIFLSSRYHCIKWYIRVLFAFYCPKSKIMITQNVGIFLDIPTYT